MAAALIAAVVPVFSTVAGLACSPFWIEIDGGEPASVQHLRTDEGRSLLGNLPASLEHACNDGKRDQEDEEG